MDRLIMVILYQMELILFCEISFSVVLIYDIVTLLKVV